jgi:hypothetical protein
MHRRHLLTVTALTAVSFTAAACGPPPPEPVPEVGGQTQMPNDQAHLNRCDAGNGTAIRDPQPPRPVSDPGPTFICVWP